MGLMKKTSGMAMATELVILKNTNVLLQRNIFLFNINCVIDLLNFFVHKP